LSSIMVVLNALRIIRTPVTAPAMADARANTALPHGMGAVAS
jgi:hypothetical protein